MSTETNEVGLLKQNDNMNCSFILHCCALSQGITWICDGVNVLMDSMHCQDEDGVVCEGETEKRIYLFQWNWSIMLLLN